MLQSEIFWCFICGFFGYFIFFKFKKKLHYGLCNQSYSGALLVNKISLVFLQSIKVILTLFFMPTILFTNIDADLCNSSENLKEISRYCTCVSRLTLTNLRKPRREHFAFVHNDYIIHIFSRKLSEDR